MKSPNAGCRAAERDENINRRRFIKNVGRSLIFVSLIGISLIFKTRQQITRKQTIGCPNKEMCQGCNALDKCDLLPAEEYRTIENN